MLPEIEKKSKQKIWFSGKNMNFVSILLNTTLTGAFSQVKIDILTL